MRGGQDTRARRDRQAVQAPGYGRHSFGERLQWTQILEDQFSVIQEGDLVRDFLDLAQLVRAHEDRRRIR